MMRANLWLRTASRVIVRVAEFRATQFFGLEQRAKKIEWERFVHPGRFAEFRVTTHKSKLYHSDAIAERLSAAVLSRQNQAVRSQPSAVSSQLFVVRVVRDQFTISADTSGDLLHMRGYRQAVGKAPLRETLGAALLLGSGWNGEAPLADPMCGSGTIPIEGAMIARRMAPGLRRRFAFEEWPAFDARDWNALRADAETAALASSPVPIIGSDRDGGAIQSARENAGRAGVSADVELSVRALSTLVLPEKPGLVATNPPYGKRASAGKDVRNLYAQLGNVARERWPGWRVALFSPEKGLERQTGLALERVFRTTNGGIDVDAMATPAPLRSEPSL
jgi:putative N6-adenine-specific DNA methylase